MSYCWKENDLSLLTLAQKQDFGNRNGLHAPSEWREDITR